MHAGVWSVMQQSMTEQNTTWVLQQHITIELFEYYVDLASAFDASHAGARDDARCDARVLAAHQLVVHLLYVADGWAPIPCAPMQKLR